MKYKMSLLMNLKVVLAIAVSTEKHLKSA